jgi:transposase
MSRRVYWNKIIALQGYCVEHVSMNEHWVNIRLRPDRRYGIRCPSCNGKDIRRQRSDWRSCRDQPLYQRQVVLFFHQPMIYCYRCRAYKAVVPCWVDPRGRCTKRLQAQVVALARVMSLSDVAEFLGMSVSTVRRIDLHYVLRTYGEPDLSHTRKVAIDEVATAKGHDYFTIVMDLDHDRVVHVGDGRSEISLMGFFDALGRERWRQIEAVAADMWEPYTTVVERCCARASIVYDKYHLIAAYHRVLDALRGEEAQKMSTSSVFKGTRYLLLKPREKLTPEKQHQLDRLLEINKPLEIAYQLGDALRNFWKFNSLQSLLRSVMQWVEMARQSAIKRLIRFADSLLEHVSGLVNYLFYPISTAKLEALNNLIGLLKRRAFGFRDKRYFKLKIMQLYQGPD